MNSAFLDAAVSYVTSRREEPYYYTLVTMEDGDGAAKSPVVSRHTFRPCNPAHDCYSIAKSVSSIAAGILCDRGLLRTDDTLDRFLPEYMTGENEKKWGRLTVDQLMRHRTGAAYGIDFDLTCAFEWPDREWLHTLFAIPIVTEPESSFVYSDANYYILGRIVERLCGKDMESFLLENLFVPLGFHVCAWSRDPLGHTVGGTGLYLRTEDLAKIGWLWLNHGVYGEKRIYSEDWSAAFLTIKEDAVSGYGYGICRVGDGMYGAGGMYNQGLLIDTVSRRVLAWHCFDDGGKTKGMCDWFVSYPDAY